MVQNFQWNPVPNPNFQKSSWYPESVREDLREIWLWWYFSIKDLDSLKAGLKGKTWESFGESFQLFMEGHFGLEEDDKINEAFLLSIYTSLSRHFRHFATQHDRTKRQKSETTAIVNKRKEFDINVNIN